MPVSVWTSTLKRTIQTAELLPFPKLRWKVLTPTCVPTTLTSQTTDDAAVAEDILLGLASGSVNARLQKYVHSGLLICNSALYSGQKCEF